MGQTNADKNVGADKKTSFITSSVRYLADASTLSRLSRSEMLDLLRGYIEPLRAFFSPGCARVELAGAGVSYGEDVSAFEAFARPLWGLAPAWAGGHELDDWATLYRRGIAAGTDPVHPEYWGDCRDYDQRFVEMAALAYAMLVAPKAIWEPLDPAVRERLALWLSQINRHEVWDNNWLFFPVLVNLALRSVGVVWDAAVMGRALDGIDAVYEGAGWYLDGPAEGPNANKDYYNPFAFHFYGMIYACFAWRDDPERCARFVARAREFAGDFARWFSVRGESVPYGRSLTYRFAQSAFFSMAALVGVRGVAEVCDAAQARSLFARNLVMWSQLPCADNAGVLQVGYHYPNLHMQEGYNAPGSPLWSLKAFAALAIPAEDPFWEGELPSPDANDGIFSTAAGSMLVQREGGEVTLYAGGRTRPRRFTHCEEKYGKFAYSTRWGFSVSVSPYSLKEAAPDSMLAFEVDGLVRVRTRSVSTYVRDGVLTSTWSPCAGVRVTTELRPCTGGHVRTHVVESDVACVAYDCGFAVSAGSLEEARGMCEVEPAPGSAAGEVVSFKTEPNTNLMAPRTVIHAVRYEIPVGTCRLVTRVSGGASACPAGE